MHQLLILTALAGAIAPETGGRLQAAEALEGALDTAERARAGGRSGSAALELGLSEAVRALGPDSEVAAELERLARGVRFEAFLAGDDGVPWLAKQLPPVISDLRLEPVREADLPVGFPEWTPVGEIQIQSYPAYRMARTSAGSTRSDGAFWKLFNHIQSNEIAMTAPVETTYSVDDEGLAQASMAFLYGSQGIGELGTEGAVDVIDIPAQVVVSAGLRGYESAGRIAEACDRLERWLLAHPEWTAAGPPRSMGHNSPMVPRDRRYFEVQIPVQRAAPIVLDFSAPGEASRWRSVDDVVMGGRSSSRMQTTREGQCVFTGDLSLENNGGFASVRRGAEGVGLADAHAVVLRVRGDGKTYQLRMRTNGGYGGPSYQAEFATVAGEWIDVTLELADFELKWRGRKMSAAEPLEGSAVTGLGLLIAGEQVGPFRLEVASLRKPRVGE